MKEEWRPILDFPSYHISSLGRVRHMERPNQDRSVGINHRGFPTLALFATNDEARRYVRQLNKLVAETFLEPPDHHFLNAIWHKDGDLLNCKASNLKWDTKKRVMEWNEMHRTKTAKYKTPKVRHVKSGRVFKNAFEAGLLTGEVETALVIHIERYPQHLREYAAYEYV